MKFKFNFKDSKNKINKMGNKRVMINLVIICLFGVLMVLVSNFIKGGSKTTFSSTDVLKSSKLDKDKNIQPINKQTNSEYEEAVQNKLKNILEQIDGVGKVELMVYFGSGEEQVPAVNINDSVNDTNEADNAGGKRNTVQKNNGRTVVITNDGEGNTKPLIVKKYKPRITGVCVVADGAENKITQLRITNAIIRLFNLSPDKVNVYPMKK